MYEKGMKVWKEIEEKEGKRRKEREKEIERGRKRGGSYAVFGETLKLVWERKKM